MFDAKSLLEGIMTGKRNGPQGSGAGDMGPLGDILGQMMGGQRGAGGGAAGGGMGPLGDILGQMMGGKAGGGTAGQGQDQGGLPSGLEDMFREMMGGGGTAKPNIGADRHSGGERENMGQSMGEMFDKGRSPGASGESAGGGIGDIMGQMFGQGRRPDAAGGQPSGAGDPLTGFLEQFSGKSPEEMMAQVREYMANNKLGAGAALGGLGALILGTQTGRSVAVTAAKVGAIALIGGLAYKAYRNYTSGDSVAASGDMAPEAAPPGTGFEEAAVSNDEAAVLIQTMIAAAAADDRVDAAEQERILGSMSNSDFGDGAEEFIADALNNPATVDEIVSHVRSKEEALKVFTAARLAIEPDTHAEKAFLAELGAKLRIEPELAAHIDAGARSAATGKL